MWQRAAAVCVLIPLALAACSAQREEGAQAEQAAPAASEAQAPQAPPPAQPESPEGASAAAAPATNASASPAPDERWLLDEFDWGDSEEIVYESVEYTDGFLCLRHKSRKHCAFVKTRVDGEELLAKFEFVDGRLWRIDVLTPDLDAAQADLHLERVWKLLSGYVTRFHGEAPEQAAFPARDALVQGRPRVTHLWKLPDQEIRVIVGRGKGAAPGWFAAARFVDPKWAAHEPAFVPDAAPAAPQPPTASPTS